MATEKKTKKTKAEVKAEVSGKAENAKQKETQKKSEEVKALQEQEKKKKAEKKPSGVQTTAGNVIRHAEVKFIQKAGVAIVTGAVYGKLVEGAKGKDAEANLKKLPNRSISKEDYLEYQRNPDKAAALNTVVAKVYPMHADDKKFLNETGQVNGRNVDYVKVNFVTKEDVEKGYAFENQIGKAMLRAGVKGEKDGRVIAILSPKEVAMWRHRAEVELSDKGQVVSVGAPITKLDLADAVAKRQLATREAREALVSEAKGIDWGKYSYPVGSNVSRVHTQASNQDDRIWINGEVNNTPIKGVLLTPVETLAVREKVATLEQVFMHNANSRKQAFDINKANYQDLKNNSEQYSIAAIAKRAADPASGARFTKEQVDIINIHLGKTEDRDGAVVDLFEKAEVKIKEAGVDESWLDSVKDELKEIAAGQWKEKQESVSMGR